jgi:hypothetical protein
MLSRAVHVITSGIRTRVPLRDVDLAVCLLIVVIFRIHGTRAHRYVIRIYVQYVHVIDTREFMCALRFDTGSLKLSVVCPTMRPNIILFADRIHFGRCTMNVRHEQLLFVRNVTERPVPLKISLPDPIGPFFCSFVLLLILSYSLQLYKPLLPI